MGNTQTTNYSEQFPLSNSPLIFLRKTRFGKGREAVDTWTAEYNACGGICELELAKTNADQKQNQDLTISIRDHASNHTSDYVTYKMEVSLKMGLLSGDVTVNGPSTMLRPPQCKLPTAQGGVLKSSAFFYGTDAERMGLVVMLRARTHDDDDELPYMITVKHYFFSAYYSHGVSLVAKMCSNGEKLLKIEIEKPSKHSKGELLKMFDDVKVRGWWPDPTSSDWALKLLLPNQNDNPVPSNNNTKGLINNGGHVNGNGNGSIIVHKHYYRSRRLKIWFEGFGGKQ